MLPPVSGTLENDSADQDRSVVGGARTPEQDEGLIEGKGKSFGNQAVPNLHLLYEGRPKRKKTDCSGPTSQVKEARSPSLAWACGAVIETLLREGVSTALG